ncbi:TasA family protein [Solibacillus sp. FSL W8-0474]|uniref:TasA family protein n=1 Tax=Solibacillus sp. FSL W8-0474 TaxID=2975336 RepID=UPI0030F95C19
MSIKKKLAMGIATGALAVSMIGGGTYAFFSDTVTSTNSFTAGTLDLSLNPTEIINVENIKPGDKMTKTFKLTNDGTLNIANVLLKTEYEVTDLNNNNSVNFGKDIKAKFMWGNHVIYEDTLFNLRQGELNTQELLKGKNITWAGLAKDETQELKVEFEFINRDYSQDYFQGDSLSLTWNFKALQGNGVEFKLN